MKIYLTRHSKTLWNQEKRLQGRKDSPLVEEGIENALALKQYLQDMSFDYIYASPIPRAYQTAQLIFENQNIIKEPLLMEMNFGDFEGCLIKELSQTKLYNHLWHQPELFTRIPHGESYDEVIDRAKQFIDKIKKHDSDSQIMVVTHGMYFIVLLATMLGLSKKEFVQLNQNVVDGCSLTCLVYHDHHFALEFYNECSYLPHVSYESFAK